MLPIVSYEMVRQRNDERRERSIRRFWWRYARTEPAAPASTKDADVIEVVFGTRCDLEESLGA